MDCTAKVIVNVQVFFVLFYYEVQDSNQQVQTVHCFIRVHTGKFE